jgi:AraC family transcriptional activator of tynA and feaB
MRFYSTLDVARAQRAEYWAALASETIVPVSVEVDRPGHFEGRLWAFKIAGIDVTRAYSSAVVLRRTAADVARTQERAFVVTLAEDSPFCVRVKGRERIVGPNDLIIGSVTEPSATAHNGCTALTLRVPEADFKRHLPTADDLTGFVVPGDHGAGLMAAMMIRSLAAKGAGSIDPRSAEHVAEALLHMIAAAYAATHGARAIFDDTAKSRRYDILRFVEAHLGDAELCVGDVAAVFGVSDRYVRMLFEESDEPLSAYIHRRRLEECARELRDPLLRRRTVSEIAFTWGFNSLGSFDRVFKARFDMTPGQYRKLTIDHTERA